MKYKVLALDLDGTLTNSAKEVSQHTRLMLERAQQAGVVVVLASGRPTPGVQWVADMIGLEKQNGYLLAYNGSEIIHSSTGEKAFDFYVNPEYIPYIYNTARENGVQMAMYHDGVVWCDDVTTEWIQLECALNHMPSYQTQSLLEEFEWKTPKCMISGKPDILERLERVLNDAVGEHLGIFRSEPYFLEVMPQGLNKASALGLLLEHLGCSREQLVACGDGFNDVHMVEYAGLGVAMANACEPVKAVADFITKSNDEDGVAYVVEKFMLNE
jgi:Cof subfamily protein (haloacid dehalogenase superfamily)